MGRIKYKKYKNQPCAYWAERMKLLLTIGYAVSLQIKTNSTCTNVGDSPVPSIDLNGQSFIDQFLVEVDAVGAVGVENPNVDNIAAVFVA